MEKPKNKLAGLDKTKSFKQKKKIQKGSRGYGLKQIARMTLGSGNMQLAVELPAGEDLNEWLAVNTIEFYNEINVLYGILTEFCTAEICPTMSAGPKYEYLWADGHNVKTPLKVSASEYIDFLMTWVENQLNNEKIFPCQLGVPFPKNFINIIKVIFKRLFRVYAHIYHTHFQHIMLLSAETHLNTCFKHFIYFIDQFNLVDTKELAPLAELIQQFKERKNESEQSPTMKKKKQDGNKSKPKADLSDTGVINDQPGESINDNQEDSFQRMYSKELDLDEDEVPIILHELNDSAIHFISRDQYDRALQLLQKAQTLIDVKQTTDLYQRLQFQRNPNDRFIVLLTMHNMALCFQKLGALEECALCLEASLQSINSPFLLPKFQGDPSRKLKKLKYECKAHMQVCALLSQLHRHKEALKHAEKSVQIAQYMISDILQMCQFYHGKVVIAKKNEQIAQEIMMVGNNKDMDNNESQQQQQKDLIYYDDSVSMLERTAYRILPIIQEVADRMIKQTQQVNTNEPHKNIDINEMLKSKLNMKAVLGYLNQSEWLYLLNIGNIMQITPLTVHDLYSNQSFEVELTRDSILEKVSYFSFIFDFNEQRKISFLAVSYFCISTELRFLFQIKDDPTIDPAMKKRESEFWHAKALEISCSFLPSECPLVSHILTSYQKHHAPVQQEIPEDMETASLLKVVRPLPGIDICKFQPMVRQDETLNISLPPLPLSPNNYGMQRRQNSMDQKQTQIMSLPFSPNNQGTTNASQNAMFSSQLGNIKNQTTDSSSSHFVPSQRQTQPQNRFNKNKNNIQHANKPLNRQGLTDIQAHAIEVDQQVLGNSHEDQDMNFDSNNQSMMDVIPSANYKKLLHDFSNNHNSSDIIEEDDENQQDQFFEIYEDNGEAAKHLESQEVEVVMDNVRMKRKGTHTASENRRIKNYNNSQQNQVLDISQDMLEDEEDDLDNDDEEENEHFENLHERSFQIKSKNQQKQIHNLSLDGQKVKRPSTSQAVRKSNKQLRQQLQQQNNTVRMQQMHQQDLKIIKNNSALQMVPSADGVSPNNGQRLLHGTKIHHNQSMATTHGKLSKLQTATNGFNIASFSQNTQGLTSGNQTDLKGNSTPIKSTGKQKSGFQYNRENMNMSRANLERNGEDSNNQISSSTDLLISNKRPNSKNNKRQRNYEASSGQQQVNKRNVNNNTQQNLNTHHSINTSNGMIGSANRSNSQQKKYLTSSGTKSKHLTGINLQDSLLQQQQLIQQNQSQKFMMTNESAQKAMNDIFLMDRLVKKRTLANNTQEQPSQSFEIEDAKYSSQHLGQNRSKSRSKVTTSRSKEKAKTKSSGEQQNIEELKRQILMKQALMDSNKSTRRKSTGGVSNGGQQKKRVDNANNSLVGIGQQMNIQGNQSQQWIAQQQHSAQKSNKSNTHQLIKKFLKERQYTTNTSDSANQYLHMNNSVLENYQGQIFQPDLGAYKLQLSKKIMQQQQKLLGAQQTTQPRKKKQSQFSTEPHPKRSATPMIDLDESQSKANQKIQQNSFGMYMSNYKQDKSLSDIGNIHQFPKDYGQDLHNQSLRENSFVKSMKKKQTKKVTPKNVITNSSFAWM